MKQTIRLDEMPPLGFLRFLRSGKIPLGFIEHPVVLWDSSTALPQYFVWDENPASLRAWLSTAVFPVFVDPTYTSQPDGTAGDDTYINSSTATTNHGTETSVHIGESSVANNINRTLIKFDFSSIPSGATADSAVFSLWKHTSASDTASTESIYRQKRDWVETQATWIIWKTSNDWASGGGFHADDCEQTAIASRSVGASDANGEKQWTNFTLSMLQDMWNGTWTNNGWLIKAETESNNQFGFRSSDYTTAGERPKMVIEYTAPTFKPQAAWMM